MKTIALAALIAIGLPTIISPAYAQMGQMNQMSQAGQSGTAQGEVRKVDKDTGKVTLRHGPVKGMDMMGMTMAFPVKDKAMLDQVKVGDKVDFTLTKEASGDMVVTRMQPTKN